MQRPLWQPNDEDVQDANITRFIEQVRSAHDIAFEDYAALHRWSVDEPSAFWEAIWDYTNVIATKRDGPTITREKEMPGAAFFPEVELNFAENLLRRRDDAIALIFQGEAKTRRSLTYAALYEQVSQVAATLVDYGVKPGDRVVGYLPNMPETIVAMLGAASVGAVWSSCSPDFGVQGVLDRFGQIEPTVLFAADGYYYNGQWIDCLARLQDIQAGLPSLTHTIVVPYLLSSQSASAPPNTEGWETACLAREPREIAFAQLPFNHPLYVMYSSGTTGAPKCIVHGAGGTLLQHLKEHQLHADVRPGDRLFYFTTCGWMMWNWLVSGLASEATLVLYDGSPFHPSGETLFDLVDDVEVNIFGTSAKFIDSLKKAGLRPRDTHRLTSMRAILSTGSPLVPESFDYVYEAVKPNVRLSSITGGTDLLGCFAQGVPTLPVWRGELQCLALGMNVEVWSDEGESLVGEKGELVCVTPFPSMPIGFWNDPTGEKYHDAYFAKYPNVWCHGDYVELTEHGGMVVHGRSDAVLNPGGVRIGTAEIYRQVEQLDEVAEGLVIGQAWDDDTRIVLFVVLTSGRQLDNDLTEKIKRRIREHATPRHVPARVVQVNDIPRTKSGKIVELAVREVVHGRPVKNREALANPEALEYFADRAELLE